MLKCWLLVLLMFVIALPDVGVDGGGVSRESITTPVIVRPQRDIDSRGPLPVLRSRKWGYIDHAGAVVIAPQFEEAGFFYEGRAAVRVGTLWGYVDATGKVVVPAQFGSAARFSDGLAHVRLPQTSAARARPVYIDSAGHVVISCDADSADMALTAARCGRPFDEGLVAEAIEVFRCVDDAGNPIAKDYPCRAILIDRWGFDPRGRVISPVRGGN